MFMDCVKSFVQEIKERPQQAVIGGYLLSLGCGLSLYLYDGYYGISYDKFLFWQKHSLIFMGLLIVSLIFVLIRRKQKPNREFFEGILKSMDYADYGMLAYAIANTISFVTAVDREEALWGTFGWNVGWLSQMIMVFWYFAVKKLYRWHAASSWMFISGAILVMITGILQRMGYVKISDGAGEGMYLSTIGNINWYAGYLSVMVPLILGMFLGAKEKPWRTAVYCLSILISFLALICNGSNSVYLFLFGTAAVMFLLSLSSLERFRRFCLTVSMYGIASELLYHYLSHSPAWSFFQYNHDNYGILMIEKHRGLYLAAAAAAVYLLAEWFAKQRKRVLSEKNCMNILKVFALAAFLGLLGLTIAQAYDLLPIPNGWGNNRGALWRIASFMYRKLPLYRKLIGVGPDCFCFFLINDTECRELLMKIYATQILTNAHSEILTMVVNIGWLGALSFLFTAAASVFLSIPRLFERGERARTALFIILVTAGALTHFLVSFQHMMLMPYLFVILAANPANGSESAGK